MVHAGKWISLVLLMVSAGLWGQDASNISFGGRYEGDGRFLLGNGNDWVWSEHRLSLRLDQRFSDRSRFHTTLWARSIGIPEVTQMSHLYNKGISDPFQAELREMWVELRDFPAKGFDVIIGRQHVGWGTADGIGPTDLLNAPDMEDLLDFGRKRGADGVSLTWYPWQDFSLQAVFLPRFRTAMLPVGVFSDILTPPLELPMGLLPGNLTDTVVMPLPGLGPQAAAGLRAKGFLKGVDFSFSYQLVRDGLPYASMNTLAPGQEPGYLDIHSHLRFARYHVAGFDMATSLAGVGVWGEAALHFPDKDLVMQTDITPLFPGATDPIIMDSILVDKTEPYLKWLVGADYHFANGSYLNIQFLKGFIHEHGRQNLDNYFFIRYELPLFQDRITVVPVNGAFIISDFQQIEDNHAIIYMPEVAWQPNLNTTLSVAAVVFQGKGDGMFSRLNDFSQFRLRLEYFF